MNVQRDPDWSLIGAAHILALALYEAEAQAYRDVDCVAAAREWVALRGDAKMRYIRMADAWLKEQAPIPATVLPFPRESAQPCGCDPGAGWVCQQHQEGA